ncbi:hypothetical protein F3K40_12980 [Streptomyces sp. LBUM 1478]|nr:hypothetical protein [Streptomyces sp. LBUM 1478]MBP5930877.1 hypothetical protein [Streptomyces sp. LBUM 1479]
MAGVPWSGGVLYLIAVEQDPERGAMEREQLERLLDGGDDTSSAALAALRAGASYVVWDGPTSAMSLATIYGRRLRLTSRRGIETSGLARAVQRLDLYSGGTVRLGRIRTADGSWVFMLFLAEDGSTLVACTGVRQTPPGAARPDLC